MAHLDATGTAIEEGPVACTFDGVVRRKVGASKTGRLQVRFPIRLRTQAVSLKHNRSC